MTDTKPQTRPDLAVSSPWSSWVSGSSTSPSSRRGLASRLEGSGIDLPADYNWNLEDLNEQPVQFSRFKGKTVFLNIWATWCGPCVRRDAARSPGWRRTLVSRARTSSSSASRPTTRPTRSRRFVRDKNWPMTVLHCPIAARGLPDRGHPGNLHHHTRRSHRGGRGRSERLGQAGCRRLPREDRRHDQPDRPRPQSDRRARPARARLSRSECGSPGSADRSGRSQSDCRRICPSPRISGAGFVPAAQRLARQGQVRHGEHQAGERDREEQSPRQQASNPPRLITQPAGRRPGSGSPRASSRCLPRESESESITPAFVIENHVGELRAPHGHVGSRGERSDDGHPRIRPWTMTRPTRSQDAADHRHPEHVISTIVPSDQHEEDRPARRVVSR